MFSTKGAATNALILVAFVVVAVLAALMAVRGVGRGWALLERTLETSGQLAIRLAVVMVFALGALAATLGLDLLLGGFVAGVIARLALKGREVHVLRVEAHSGRLRLLDPLLLRRERCQVRPRRAHRRPDSLLELPLFLGLFLIVRGTPALLLYRGVLDLRDRDALAVFSATGLPLIVAITTIAVWRATCAHPPPPPSSAQASCRPRSCPSSACGCEPGPPRTTTPLQPQDETAAAARA